MDDDAINRAAIFQMISWEKYGFKICGVMNNGKSALQFFVSNHVDVVLTDMKMPIMDGLELSQEIRKIDQDVIIIALSSYSDFELVRQAFKCDVEDYILKSELDEVYLGDYIKKIKTKLDNKIDLNENAKKSVPVIAEEKFQYEHYYTMMLRMSENDTMIHRFMGQEEGVFPHVRGVIEQIPKVAKSCYIVNYNRTDIVVCYETKVVSEESIKSFAMQLNNVLKNFLNIDVRIGISDYTSGAQLLDKSIEQAANRLTIAYIFGNQKVFLSNQYGVFNIDEAMKNRDNYAMILESLKELNDKKLFEAQSCFINDELFNDVNLLKIRCLELLYFEGLLLDEIGDSIWQVWDGIIDLEKKLFRLEDSNSIVMWLLNYNRWVINYLKNKYESNLNKQSIETICRYIEDNYIDPTLSLYDVASVAGLNEKYFSAKFKKEMGVTFLEYLSNIRMEAAKNLLKKTDMKISDISEAIGYNNVEHFVRMFKKRVGTSPKEWGKMK